MEQMPNIYSLQLGWQEMTMVAFVVLLLVLLGVLLSLYHRVVHIRNHTAGGTDFRLKRRIEQFSSKQLDTLLQQKRHGTVKQKASPLAKKAIISIFALAG